jgi:hypothetical protein
MMTQRNIEIQLQALDLIRRQASLPKDDDPKLDEAASSMEAQVEQIVAEEIEKAVETETQSDAMPELPNNNEEDNDKFKRLNLFFEQEKVINLLVNIL